MGKQDEVKTNQKRNHINNSEVVNNISNSHSNVNSFSIVVRLPKKSEAEPEKRACMLADALDDLFVEKLPVYIKTVQENRSDLLNNCLKITLEAHKKGIITRTKHEYFFGVLRNRKHHLKVIESFKKIKKDLESI